MPVVCRGCGRAFRPTDWGRHLSTTRNQACRAVFEAEQALHGVLSFDEPHTVASKLVQCS
jgi:hypothetical protein